MLGRTDWWETRAFTLFISVITDVSGEYRNEDGMAGGRFGLFLFKR